MSKTITIPVSDGELVLTMHDLPWLGVEIRQAVGESFDQSSVGVHDEEITTLRDFLNEVCPAPPTDAMPRLSLDAEAIITIIEGVHPNTPWPANNFIEPTYEQYEEFNKHLLAAGLTPDGYAGSLMRRAYNLAREGFTNAIREAEEDARERAAPPPEVPMEYVDADGVKYEIEVRDGVNPIVISCYWEPNIPGSEIRHMPFDCDTAAWLSAALRQLGEAKDV